MKKNLIFCMLILMVAFIFNFSGCVSDNDMYASGYTDLIGDLTNTINRVLSESFEDDFNNGKFISPDESFEYEWGNMLIDAKNGLENPKLSDFGYILKDINADNIPELFFVRDDSKILAVFTLDDNKPKLLGAFWSRYGCIMLDDDTLYVLSSNGANNFEYTIYRLTVENELSAIKQFGMNESYYEKIDNEIISITDVQFNEILESNPYVFGKSWLKNAYYSFKQSIDSSMIDN